MYFIFFLGGEVELTCTIRNGKEYPILWMRLQSEHNANSLPLSNGPNLIVKDRRFNLNYDPDSGSYKLTIRDVVKSDEGKYQCQVYITQFGNSKIFLPLRFYVKSIFENLEVLKLPILPF